MKEETVSDALLRAFLLGKLDSEQQERIEGLYLTNSQERERILSAEQELIEDYLEDSFTPEDKQRFIALHARTPEQLRKLRNTRSIQDWAIREATLPVSTGAHLVTGWWLKSVFVIPIAVAAMIAIVVGVVWLDSRERERRHLAIERELAELNSPSGLRESLPQMISVDLSPGAVRGEAQQAEIKKSGVSVVDVRLLWVRTERYPNYEAEINRVGNDEYLKITSLQGENDRGYVVRLRIKAHMLEPGQHQVRLNGINADGSAGLMEEYLFTVGE
jgi:hypothetical protein